MMKKVIKKITFILLFIILSIAAVAAIFIYATKNAKSTIDEYKTNDEKYTLTIEQIGDPDWPFGYTHCQFVLEEENKAVAKYKFDLANDGANASTLNFEVYFFEDYVMVYANAKEQGKIEYDLFYDGTVKENYVNQDETAVGNDDDFYDDDGVLKNYGEQELKNEYDAIFNYLTTEGSLKNTEDLSNAQVEMNYYYSAKGEQRIVVCTYETELDGVTVHAEQELRYNKTVDTEDEFVFQENYYDADGNEAQSSKILDFFMVDRDTLKVIDTGRTNWE